MTKAKKLPKVWVYFRNGRVMTADLMKNRPLPDETVHAYTPAKPAKVCRTVACPEVNEAIANRTYGVTFNYCPYCGGKIRTR